MSQLIKPIPPGAKVLLDKHPTNFTAKLEKKQGVARTLKLQEELCELQNLMYGAQSTPVLIVLQGMDTSGKDGVIRHVVGAVSPQGCRIASFKAPTPQELAHDFLWRIHREAPLKGEIAVFNRSHYEDVLVARVHDMIPLKVWKERYDLINAFEKQLASSGTLILKFFLHISKKEQEKRLIEREEDPTKSWKLSARDWKEREHWDEYMKAYEDAICNCSTDVAPWHIIPSDRKWFRNLAISQIIVNALKEQREKWEIDLKEIGTEALAELREMRGTKR